MAILVLICLLTAVMPADELPFSVTCVSYTHDGLLTLRLQAPEKGYVTRENISLELPAGHQSRFIAPPNSPSAPEDSRGVFRQNDLLRFQITPPVPLSDIHGTLQGCVNDLCYLPQSFSFTQPPPQPDSTPKKQAQLELLLRNAEVIGTCTGYQSEQAFLKFLSEESPEETTWLQWFHRRFGFLAVALVIIPLGLLLNLTPCVLPMIPITLGILGISAKGNRKRGIILGAVYGGAQALSYGLLGILCVTLGGQFSTLNSSPIFNIVTGVIFLLLAAAMMDLLTLDLSRFRWSPSAHHRGSLAGAAILGVMSALLSSACIAPVLVGVLLLSAQLYQQGIHSALLFPLLLGIGLGSPWPMIGAGLAYLPKPGRWMLRVKQILAAMILIAALTYFHHAWQLHRQISPSSGQDTLWRQNLTMALAEARETRKDLLLDFGGVSCKACTLMDRTTLRKQSVIQCLTTMIPVRIYADDLKNPETALLLERFHIIGFPTYLRLKISP